METNKIPARADVPEKDKWAIQDLFATDDDWRAALAKAKEFIPRITAFRGRLAESGAALLSFFRLDDEISLAFDALVHYAQRRSDEDTRVAAYQEMVSQVTRFAVEIQSAAAFETPELLAISDEDMNRLYAEAPELELYRLNIDRIRRRREHVLSDKEEAILAAAGEMAASPDDIYSMLNDADLKFPDAVDKDVISSSYHFVRFKLFPCCQYRCIALDGAVRFYCHETFFGSQTFFLRFDHIEMLWIDFRNNHWYIRCPAMGTVVGNNRCLCFRIFFFDRFDLIF